MRRPILITLALVVTALMGVVALADSNAPHRVALAWLIERFDTDPVGHVDPEMRPATTVVRLPGVGIFPGLEVPVPTTERVDAPQPLRRKPPCRKHTVFVRYGREVRCDVQPGQVLVMTFPKFMSKPYRALICDHFGGDIDSGDCYGLDF